MMEVTQVVRVLLQWLVTIAMWTSIVLFVLKTVWNFGVPYAIVREARQHPNEKHGWSVFVLFDVGLLVLAVMASALAGKQGLLGPWRLALYGLGTIVASYVHLGVVLLVLGYTMGLFREKKG